MESSLAEDLLLMGPLVYQAEMAKAGIAVSNNLCPHFAMSRADLFNVVK